MQSSRCCSSRCANRAAPPPTARRVRLARCTANPRTGAGAAAPPPAAAAAAATADPTVEVTVHAADGAASVAISCPSGEQLRYALLDNKVDLYTTWGKIWSCGGAGQCGTCIVQVMQGAELLSERTSTEEKKLKGKPADWRLACQTIVGDGARGGKVTLVTKPQSK